MVNYSTLFITRRGESGWKTAVLGLPSVAAFLKATNNSRHAVILNPRRGSRPLVGGPEATTCVALAHPGRGRRRGWKETGNDTTPPNTRQS